MTQTPSAVAIAAIVLSKGHYLPITDRDRFTAAGAQDYLHRLQETTTSTLLADIVCIPGVG